MNLKENNKEERKGRPLIKIKWSKMYWIVLFCTTFHLIGSVFGLLLIYAAIYINKSLESHLNLITHQKEGLIVTTILLLVGSTSFLFHFPEAIIVIKFSKHRIQKGINLFLMFLIFVHIIWALVVLVVGVGILFHSYSIHERTSDVRFIETMNKYNNDLEAKNAINEIQFQFQCCGSKSYKDWFSIRWSGESNGLLNQSGDSVPFSCCALGTLNPCIHENINGHTSNYAYSPEQNFSLSTDGCHDTLIKRAKTLSWIVAVGTISSAIYQILVFFVTRIVQTGHSNLYKFDRREAITCWLLGTSSCKKRSNESSNRSKGNRIKVTLSGTTKIEE